MIPIRLPCRPPLLAVLLALAMVVAALAPAGAADGSASCPPPASASGVSAAGLTLMADNPLLGDLWCRDSQVAVAVLARLEALLAAPPVPPRAPAVQTFALDTDRILAENPALGTVFLNQPEAALDLIRVIQNARRERN